MEAMQSVRPRSARAGKPHTSGAAVQRPRLRRDSLAPGTGPDRLVAPDPEVLLTRQLRDAVQDRLPVGERGGAAARLRDGAHERVHAPALEDEHDVVVREEDGVAL